MKKVLCMGILTIMVCLSIFSDIPKEFYATFVETCTTYNVPIEYASRLIAYESGWNPKFINKNKDGSKDYSLCQLNSNCLYDLRRWHNDGKPFDPMNWRDNLRIGIAHMRFLYDRNGESWWAAVACYNMGERGFSEWCAGRRKLPDGTQQELNFIFQ